MYTSLIHMYDNNSGRQTKTQLPTVNEKERNKWRMEDE